MTLQKFFENENYVWSFDYDQIDTVRLIESDGYKDYSYDKIFFIPFRVLSEKTLKKKIAFMVYDPHNYTMNIFLED